MQEVNTLPCASTACDNFQDSFCPLFLIIDMLNQPAQLNSFFPNHSAGPSEQIPSLAPPEGLNSSQPINQIHWQTNYLSPKLWITQIRHAKFL